MSGNYLSAGHRRWTQTRYRFPPPVRITRKDEFTESPIVRSETTLKMNEIREDWFILSSDHWSIVRRTQRGRRMTIDSMSQWWMRSGRIDSFSHRIIGPLVSFFSNPMCSENCYERNCLSLISRIDTDLILWFDWFLCASYVFHFYCPYQGMGEKPSPLGEDFSLTDWASIHVSGVVTKFFNCEWGWTIGVSRRIAIVLRKKLQQQMFFSSVGFSRYQTYRL